MVAILFLFSFWIVGTKTIAIAMELAIRKQIIWISNFITFGIRMVFGFPSSIFEPPSLQMKSGLVKFEVDPLKSKNILPAVTVSWVVSATFSVSWRIVFGVSVGIRCSILAPSVVITRISRTSTLVWWMLVEKKCHHFLDINHAAGIFLADLWIIETSGYQTFWSPVFRSLVTIWVKKDPTTGRWSE